MSLQHGCASFDFGWSFLQAFNGHGLVLLVAGV